MSRSPFFFVEKFNVHTNHYELCHPIVWNYTHTKQELADLYPFNGNHDLFSIVENRNNYFPKMKGIHTGLPNEVCNEIKNEYDRCTETYDTNVYTPNARWFTYADMYIYCIENPTALDYEAMDITESDEKIFMPTPMLSLKNRVDAFLEVTEDFWENDYSLIRIVYWIG